MDAVITYVDGSDPVWQKEYENFTKRPIITKRYRDWGTLRYVLRGIESKMPFIRNVYLVVSHPSQVPQWADRDELKIVLHKDIIPQEFLPTFNSTAIEMFLHRIDGLDERYLYFNDDTIPVMDCSESDFYDGDKIIFGFSSHILSIDMYKKQCRNSDRIARKVAGRPASLRFVRPQHICTPMIRSSCETLYKGAESEIRQSVTALRDAKNINQYAFLDYLYYSRRVINRRCSKKHFSLAVAGSEKICSFLRNPDRKLVCINDVEMSQEKFEKMSSEILSSLEALLPKKSRFEL